MGNATPAESYFAASDRSTYTLSIKLSAKVCIPLHLPKESNKTFNDS